MTTDPTEARPWPSEIRLKRTAKTLYVAFDDGMQFELPAEYLRVESPSAEVQGHGQQQKQLVAGKRQVAITDIQPIGHYAVRLVFDDGHATGLYTWETLYRLGQEQDRLWQDYLTQLETAGLSRD